MARRKQGSAESPAAKATAQRPTLMILLGALLAAVVTMAAAATAGEPMVRLPNNHLPIAATWTARADKDFVLWIRLHYKVRNKAESDKLAAEFQDPKSPNYRHWLTSRELRARFGPTPGEVKELSAWLSRQGFEVVKDDRLYLTVTGTVATAERAFGTTIVMSPDGRHANQTDPQIPARFAPVVEFIWGLDNTENFINFIPAGPQVVPQNLRSPTSTIQARFAAADPAKAAPPAAAPTPPSRAWTALPPAPAPEP